MSKILENLYLGSFADAKSKVFLKQNNITHILTVGIELQALYPESYKYMYIPAYDDPKYKLNAYFEEITEFIHDAIQNEKGNVFVHCYWGISRSATSVLAYLIKHYKMPPMRARLFLKSKRPIIYPNEGFISQLGAFAKKLGVLDKSNIEKPIKVAGAPMPSLGNGDSLRSSLGLETQRNVAVDTDAKATDQDFFCKVCAAKLFHTQDIIHNKTRRPDASCDSVYLKFLPWMKNFKTGAAKIFCPNTKCNTVLGTFNKHGGSCACGKQVDVIHAVYSSRIVSTKAKTNVIKARSGDLKTASSAL